MSDFSNVEYYQNKRDYNGEPEVLPYRNNKILGFYSDDYSFEFFTIGSRVKIRAVKTEIVFKKTPHSRRPRPKKVKKVVGEYELFQPITLMEMPKDNELNAPALTIPAFYLKAIDDKNKWKNFEKSIWLGVDVLTTFTGIINLAKLRFLRHLTKTQKAIKLGFGALEITAGTLGIFFDYIDNVCDDKKVCEKIREVLFWLELSTLGADVLVEKLIKKKGKEATDLLGEAIDKTKDSYKQKRYFEMKQNLDEILDLVKKEIRVYKGVKYEIKIYKKHIVWSVLEKDDFWENSAKLQQGVLEFDFHTYGIKGLGQHWTDETFEVFGDRIEKVKATWKLDPKYPNGESLGHIEFWKEMSNSYDKEQAIKVTTFYNTMREKGFDKINDVVDDFGETVVELTK